MQLYFIIGIITTITTFEPQNITNTTMSIKKYLIATPLLLLFALLLISWGGTGHYSIGSHAYLSFNQEMQPFNNWMDYIADHSSDADYRKSEDPNEGPRHYIDIDNYSEFISSGTIPQSLDEVIAAYGHNFVYDNGVLPWVTLYTYDSLVACLQRADWEKARYFAADLSHYVADGHMPLHITKNYNGQLTGNTGIHSRYESTMINAHIGDITFLGNEISSISNISDYVFNYLYANFPYVDSIIEADDYAKTFSTSYSTAAYKDALWNKSKTYTGLLLNNAAHALAELMYNAWLEAGSPDINGNAINNEQKTIYDFKVSPNPFQEKTTFTFDLLHPTELSIHVYNLTGKKLVIVDNETFQANSHSINWNANDLATGVYMIVVETPQSRTVKKVIVR